MIYKHYKTGDLYELVCEAKHSESLEEMVVYKSIKTGATWVRPKVMFFGTVTDPDGRQPVPRFAVVHET